MIEGSLEVKLPTIWTDGKARGGKSQRREGQKREDQRRERVRRKKMQGCEKVGTSQNIVFFQWFVAPEGRKVGSLKRRVRSHLARWEMKNSTPLWRKHISKSKVQKTDGFGAFLEVEMSKKRTPLWREAHFQVKSAKNWQVWSTFGRSDVVLRGRRKGLCTLSEVSKPWGFCGISKNHARRGTFEEELERCIFRGRRSTRDMFTRAVRRSARRWFPEGLHFGASDLQLWEDDFAWQVQHFVWPGSTFSWQAQYFRDMGWKKCKIASFLTLSSSKVEEVLQSCVLFDVIKFKSWRSLAE